VRVIPEFYTPAHTQSWGKSDKYKDIVVKCNKEYQGQFDPTLNLTYEVVNDVMLEVNNKFIDGYAHFGGDEIV
jgi:hexosaminidase